MDQVKSNFFENQILEAIQTVANGIVSKLQFDQTILCTITNDEKRKKGIYEVSNGSSTFQAFSSDTNYKKDMAVYVLVPQGDFERQKTIVGKYVDDTATAINYIPASQSIIEVAKMEIPQDEFSLLANGESKLINIIDSDWNNTNIYDCVSLKANFKTDLSKYNIIDGDYGLMLTLKGYQVKSETKDGALDQTIIEMAPKFYKFSCKDMFGDPYNYNIYFDQDIVFDLSKDFADIKINHYRLDFYQNGKFSNLNGKDIPYRDTINNVDFNNNLFVKDIQMSFGYSTVDIKEEGIQIYTPDNLKYIDRLPKKNIVLKWFQKNEVGSNTVYGIIDTLKEAEEEKNYSIYWYRYRIGASEDELAGAFWELLEAEVYNDNISYEYELVEDPNGKYTYKGSKLILADSDNVEDKRYRMQIKTETEDDSGDDEKPPKDPFNISFAPDKLLNREKIKAILVKYKFEEIQEVDENDSNIVYITFKLSPKIYESNEIIFENANPASLSLAAVDLIKNMRLECADNSNGVYKLYNTVDNEIINNENTKEKILNVFFDTYSSIDIPKEQEQCKITWKIPKYNSMINPVNFTVNNNLNKTLEEGDAADIPTLGENIATVTWEESDLYHECSYEWKSNIAGFDSVHENAELLMKYSIEKFYTPARSNNTIICEIEKYGKTYTAEIEFIFGETGTNGTGYTVSLKLEKEYDDSEKAITATAVPCLTHGGNKVKVIASLFDEHGKDISEGKVFKWNWLNNVSGFTCDIAGKDTETAACYIQHDGATSIDKCYGILSATVAGDWFGKNVQLTGYLPLGIRSSSDAMKTYEGTTKIIYNEQGIKPTYQKEHSLDTATTKWEVKVLKDNNDEWKNYSPQFKTRQIKDIGPWILVARDMYFSDLAKEQIVIHAYKNNSDIIYSQSLLYDQNRFGNAMFNNWDGSLVVNEKENKILTAIIGAGKKETDNTFSGVLMGDFTYKTSIETEGSIETKTVKKTGLLGFKNSLETFGFHTDGTAFIGPSGQGRIEFDGTRGIIQSYTGNTKLNLTTGEIYLANDDAASAKIILDSTGKAGYFSIKDKENDKNLIYIGSTGYYLQSKNFSDDDTSKTGVKLDLNNGKLTGYNFLITATGTDGTLTINSSDSDYPLKIGTNFKVGWDGKIEATGGTFTGEITATKLTLDGCQIPYSDVSDTPDLDIYIEEDGTIGTGTFANDGNSDRAFKVSSDGLLQAKNAVIYGTVYASEGEIAGFTIKKNMLSYGGDDLGASLFICPDGKSGKGEQMDLQIGDYLIEDIVLKISDNFAIGKDGKVSVLSLGCEALGTKTLVLSENGKIDFRGTLADKLLGKYTGWEETLKTAGITGNFNLVENVTADSEELDAGEYQVENVMKYLLSGEDIPFSFLSRIQRIEKRMGISESYMDAGLPLDSLYASKSHTHSDYALTYHTHAYYALTNHTHSDYALTNHKHGNTEFWSGNNSMGKNSKVSFNTNLDTNLVSNTNIGIVLVFSYYNSDSDKAEESLNWSWQSFFIPKSIVPTSGEVQMLFRLSDSCFGNVGTKYLYISDSYVEGHANNTTEGTGASGIKYKNNLFVLRRVYGV